MCAASGRASYWERGLRVLDYRDYLSVSRTLIRAIGLNAAVLACELVSEARYWMERGKLDDGWFFSSISNVESACGLSKHCQADALKILRDSGVAEVAYKGMPRTRYVRIDASKMLDLIDDFDASCQSFTTSTTSGSQRQPLVVDNVNINKIYTNEGYVSGEGDSGAATSSKTNLQVSGEFTPPTLDDVRDYCRGNTGLEHVDPDLFYATYAAQGWMMGNNVPMMNWQWALKKWASTDRLKVQTERAKQQADANQYAYLDDMWKGEA